LQSRKLERRIGYWNAAKKRLCAAACAAAILALGLWAACLSAKDTQAVPPDITIGVRVWEYNRIYPLLDGLFQDVANTQIKSLVLDPNAANATRLDALLQVLQVQAQSSATAGLQNGLAAQQTATSSALTLQQAQLIGRQTQLIQSQVLAQNQVGIAQSTVDLLTNHGATAKDVGAAKLQLQLAQDHLTSVTAELSDVKSQIASSQPAPSFTPPPASLPTLTALPQNLTGPANVPSGFSPNIPSTKQMDNQMTLLWERLSRLVYTMNQTAEPDSQYYLIQIDTGIVPIKHKHELLSTHYQLTCGNVVDIYPRSSAVNIIDEKYRDNRVGLGALVQFLSVGANASYNREHLQVTQMLSQSSYITGYGVGKRDFGWIYGLTLGEDSISPGVRDTFVLVNMPVSTCGKLNKGSEKTQFLQLKDVVWQKKSPQTNFDTDNAGATSAKAGANDDQTNSGGTNDDKKNGGDSALKQWCIEPGTPGASCQRKQAAATTPTQPASTDKANAETKDAPESKPGLVADSVNYTPLEDDRTVAIPTAVTVTVSFTPDSRIDPETTIIADGILISRVRDTFGRAVQGGGAGGQLEAQQLQLNTWIPVNAHELILSLNPRTFGSHFPAILMESPQGTTHLTAQLRQGKAHVRLQGRDCYSCATALPPLAYPKATIAQLSAARWSFWKKEGAEKPDSHPREASILITATGDKTSSTSTTSAGPVLLQVISDANSNPWGASPQVQVYGNDWTYILNSCYGKGQNLVCPLSFLSDPGSTNPMTGKPPDKPRYVCEKGSIQVEADSLTKGEAASPKDSSNLDGAKPCLDYRKSYFIDVVDADHAGGPFHGRGVLHDCPSVCSQPLVWSLKPPEWVVYTEVNSTAPAGTEAREDADRLNGEDGWIFRIEMCNVAEDESARLNRVPRCNDKRECEDMNQAFKCDAAEHTCKVSFVLRKETLLSYRDSMDLEIFTPPQDPSRKLIPLNPIVIGGVRSQVNPLLSTISSDSKQLPGRNLLFRTMRVGASGPSVPLNCASSGTYCTVTKYPPEVKDPAFLYFVVQSNVGQDGLIPVQKQDTSGLTPVQYTPPPPAKDAAQQKQSQGTSGSTAQSAPPLTQDNNKMTVKNPLAPQ
jgi:hypothetical protein